MGTNGIYRVSASPAPALGTGPWVRIAARVAPYYRPIVAAKIQPAARIDLGRVRGGGRCAVLRQAGQRRTLGSLRCNECGLCRERVSMQNWGREAGVEGY